MTDVSGVDQSIENQATEIDGGTNPFGTPAPATPTEVYRLDPITKIPVSKYEGPLWKSRKSAGRRAIRDLITGWEEAEYYYNNAQQNHRKETQGNRSGARNVGKDRRDSYSMTENMVYATVNSVIPNIYAKNPNVEITMTDGTLDKIGVMLEHLTNKLAEMKYSPGINLKPKVRKSIVRCEITNEAWVMVGWVKRENSMDQVNADISRIGAALVGAEDQKEIERLEGELMALEESSDLLDPPGPFVKSFRGEQVLMDTGHTEDDYSDCNWIMVEAMFATVYLNARYRVKQPDGTYTSAYLPTHVVDATQTSSGTEGVQAEIDTFKMFDYERDEPTQYGYGDRQSYERGKRTKCWYVFDKVRRRFMLFADNDWTWPIWVFDDPYHFPEFYPLERLQYHTDPRMTRARGEVSHYLDQQDEINTIVDEGNRARVALRDNTIFNSSVLTTKDVEDIMLNANKKMKGVKVPDGQKLEDLIMGPPMPNLKYQFLWDKTSAKEAINIISGVGDAMRGEQFKTNTTNEAIKQYSSLSGVRLDEKRDAIEDFIGGIMAKVLFLCLQFMDQQTVGSLVGSQYQDAVMQWRNMEPDDIRKLVICSIEGGSTVKPTSAAKKAEALQIGQILGQFASNPAVVMILLKMMQRAFDGVDMTDADWQMLTDSIQQQAQEQAPQQAGAPPPQQGEPPPQQGAPPPQGGPNPMAAIIQDLVKQGMSLQQAQQIVMQKMASRTQ